MKPSRLHGETPGERNPTICWRRWDRQPYFPWRPSGKHRKNEGTSPNFWWVNLNYFKLAMFKFAKCKRLPEGSISSHHKSSITDWKPTIIGVFPWFSHGVPMVFLWFSYGFPMVFLWFSWFSYGFPLGFWFQASVWCSTASRPQSSMATVGWWCDGDRRGKA